MAGQWEENRVGTGVRRCAAAAFDWRPDTGGGAVGVGDLGGAHFSFVSWPPGRRNLNQFS